MKMKAKRILSMVLVFCLCLTMIPALAMPTEAATPGYTVSSSYKASSYYSALCNVTLTGNQRTDIVNIALSQVGYREGSYSGDYGGADDGNGSYNNYTEYNYWYHNYVSRGMPVGGDSAPWCATFVSWCAEQANIPSSILKRSTAAGHGASYFNVKFYSGSSTLASNGDNDSYFMGYNYTPKAGDLFFTRSWSHVGIVVAVNGSYVITVEGNTNTNGSSQGNGVYRLTSRKISDLYFGVPNYTNTSVKHTVDTSYGTNFTAYPKAKITAENIFDKYHSQIDSTSWIGTSDKCTIHEVYTDGCCRVTYPLDAGGTKEVYSKISLFNINTHTHNYTGSRYYESAHPHAITQRCVNYDTCGGWIYTGEYYEVKTCEQCWHADFDIGASSVSVKVGESKTVAVSVGGCLPDSAVAYPSFSPDNDVVEVTIKNQQATFTGLKEGTTLFQIRIYSDSSKSYLIGATSIRVDVATPTYTVVYNANGGSGAPGKQTKYHGTPLVLSSVKPSREGYTFLGWSESYSTSSATYQPSGTFNGNYSITLYAVWEIGCEGNSHKYVYTVTGRPTLTSTGKIVGECGYCKATTSVLLPKLNTSDYAYKVTKAATCTATGTGRYTWNTTTYGGSYYFDETIPSTGHSYSYKATKTPTTSSTGTLTGTCSKCSGTTTVTLPKLNTTDYTYSVRTAATCTSVGTGRYTWKTTTYGSFYFDVSLAKLGHSYSYKATKTPTTSATGTLTGTCSKCSGTTAVTLPKLNTTDYSYSVKTAATCTEAGSGRYTWKTTTYGSFYFDVTISKLGHNYSNGSCVRCGAEDLSAEKGKYEITNATGVAGSMVEVYVSITNNPGVISLRNTISYDTSALELISVQDCGLLAGYTTPSATINSPYTLRWADSLATQNNTSNGRIVKLVFQIKDSVETGNYSISVTPVEARNVNGGSVAFNGASAAVTVIDCIIGDTDGDGEVTDWDAIVLNRYLADWNVTIEVAAADVDDDGEVTDWDAIVLDRYLAGWNVTIG